MLPLFAELERMPTIVIHANHDDCVVAKETMHPSPPIAD